MTSKSSSSSSSATDAKKPTAPATVDVAHQTIFCDTVARYGFDKHSVLFGPGGTGKSWAVTTGLQRAWKQLGRQTLVVRKRVGDGSARIELCREGPAAKMLEERLASAASASGSDGETDGKAADTSTFEVLYVEADDEAEVQGILKEMMSTRKQMVVTCTNNPKVAIPLKRAGANLFEFTAKAAAAAPAMAAAPRASAGERMR